MIADDVDVGDNFVMINWGGRPLFLKSCPYDLLRSPEIYKIWVAHRWFDKCSFFERYPDPPVGLVHAVEAWELGRSHKEAEDSLRRSK